MSVERTVGGYLPKQAGAVQAGVMGTRNTAPVLWDYLFFFFFLWDFSEVNSSIWKTMLVYSDPLLQRVYSVRVDIMFYSSGSFVCQPCSDLRFALAQSRGLLLSPFLILMAYIHFLLLSCFMPVSSSDIFLSVQPFSFFTVSKVLPTILF
jgi:hypothetical protein